jgi:hypothetical protein
MDPNANLAEQRRIVARINEEQYSAKDLIYDAIRLAELVQALDEWIAKGGFLPTAWQTL